jgi:hypothetical protein
MTDSPTRVEEVSFKRITASSRRRMRLMVRTKEVMEVIITPLAAVAQLGR